VRCVSRLSCLFVLSIDKEEIAALTRNVSASGVAFEMNSSVQSGLLIHFSLRMPGAVLGTPHDVLVHCRDVWYAARRTKVTIWLPPPSTNINSPSSDSRSGPGKNHFLAWQEAMMDHLDDSPEGEVHGAPVKPAPSG